MFKEFRDFVLKGNLIEMAIAFVMGGAFGKVITGFVEGIVAPLISMFTGGVKFDELQLVLKEAVIGADGKETAAAVAVKYGAFLTNVIDFLVVALVMFMVVKAVNSAKKKEADKPAPAPAAQEVLLAEIRDLLKK